MEWMAIQKVTKAVTGPHSNEYKNAMESNRSTWKRHTWVPLKEFKEAALPSSLADVVKPAKRQAGSIRVSGE